MDNSLDTNIVNHEPPRLDVPFTSCNTDNETALSRKQSGTSCRKGKPIPGFGREVILKVAEMCKLEADKNAPFWPLNAPTKRAAMYSGVSERTIQRIKNDRRKLEAQLENVCAKSKSDSEKNYKQKKKKNYQGQAIAASAREIILKVMEACCKEFEGGEYMAPLVCAVERAAIYTGVSSKTIQRIRHENRARNAINQEKLLSTPGQRRKRGTFSAKITDQQFNRIRNLIYELLMSNIAFTSDYLLKAIKDLDINFPYGERTLTRLLHNKGFLWHSLSKGRKIVLEKRHIFQARLDYIKKIKTFANEGGLVVYLDEKLYGSEADSASSSSGKNCIFAKRGVFGAGRLIVFTEFSAASITRESFRCAHPNSDQPETIAKCITENWLEKNLLPKLPAGSLIVMNCHSNQEMDVPNEYSRKSMLIDFLKRKKLKHDEGQTCAQLLQVIKSKLDIVPQQCLEFDQVIEKHGHLPLRLPGFMSEFNPIALAYDDIKQAVRRDIGSTKASFATFKNITLKTLENLQEETIRKFVEGTIEMEDYFLDKEQCIFQYYNALEKKSNYGLQRLYRKVIA